jgi:hypothetical protein
MRRRHSRFAFAALVLLGGCAAHDIAGRRGDGPEWLTPWAEFSARPMLARRVTETIVQVGALPLDGAGEGFEHWFRKTTRFFGGGARVQWTDTRSCAAARAVLSNMHALEMPRLVGGGAIEVRADGVLYALTADARYRSGRQGQLSVNTPGGTPLADWVERSLAELEACWSHLPPREVRLGSRADRR